MLKVLGQMKQLSETMSGLSFAEPEDLVAAQFAARFGIAAVEDSLCTEVVVVELGSSAAVFALGIQ